MNSKPSLLRATALVLLLAGNGLHAAVIFNNLEATTHMLAVDSSTWWGQSFGSFGPDAMDSTLTQVILSLGTADTSDPAGNFFVRIYNATETGNTPDIAGSFFTLVGITLGSADPSSGIFVYEPRPEDTISLSANTPYYVVAGVSMGTGSYIWNAEDPSDVGPDSTIGFSFSPDSGVGWSPPNADLAVNMQVNVTPVPEPANMALGIFGVLLVSVQSFRWWNARRRQMDRLASR